MKEFKETAYSQCSDEDYAHITTSEIIWINKIRRMAAAYPNDVKIINENNDGSICARIPLGWFKISPPKKVNLTETQRIAAAERLDMARNAKLMKKTLEERGNNNGYIENEKKQEEKEE